MNTTMVATATAFPTSWDAIADDGLPFRHDPMHFPFPVSPLMASSFDTFAQGYLAAMREMDIPIRDMQVRVVNHYRYDRIVPDGAPDERDAAALAARTEATLGREVARMLDRWYVEHRPALLAHHERLQQMQLPGASRVEILAMLDEIDDIARDMWTIHFRIATPMLLSMQLFTELHAELFGAAGDAAKTMMAGTLSESIKAAFGLADLASLARALDIDGLILLTEPEAVVSALETTTYGRAFLDHLDDYLAAYGLRQDLFDIATRTWREDPTFAIASVRKFLETRHDPRAVHAATAHMAQLAFETARARLATYPEAIQERFELAVQHAREGAFLQEEHNFYIDQRGTAHIRLAYLRIGEHLRDRGVIDGDSDIFMLSRDEIRDLVGGLDPEPHGGQVRSIVAARRRELEIAAGMTPPPVIGDPGDSQAGPDTPITRAVAAFFGGPPRPAAAEGQIAGNPGSRGVTRGIARVARTLEEAKAVQPGEVLIAVTTMPAWTPLFGIAAAVVTETGGPLSHCAIVAREYGIPAVVGAHGATRAIATGQCVTVDGDSGTVTIEGAAA